MSSENRNKRNDNGKKTILTQSNDSRNKYLTTEKQNELTTPSEFSKSSRRVNEGKGKQIDTSHEQIEPLHDLMAKLERKYATSLMNKLIPKYVKEDEKEDNQAREADSASDPPPLILPPPTIEFYDNSFLEMVSNIIHKHLEEEDSNIGDIDKDEGRVEYSRRGLQPVVQDINPLFDYTTSPDDPFIVYSDTYDEEQLVDCTIDFDSIILDMPEDPLLTEKEGSSIKNKHQIKESPNKSPNISNNSPPNDDNKGIDLLSDNSNDIWSSKDYTSWLCFDNEGEFLKFKDDCELNGCGSVFNQDSPDYFSEIGQILRSAGYMSPTPTEGQYRGANDYSTSPIKEENIRAINNGRIRTSNIITSEKHITSSNDEKFKPTTRSIREKHINNANTLHELNTNDDQDKKLNRSAKSDYSGSNIDIEKHIINMSTPKEMANRFHSFKRTVSQRDEESILRRSPPLIRFPPRKKK